MRQRLVEKKDPFVLLERRQGLQADNSRMGGRGLRFAYQCTFKGLGPLIRPGAIGAHSSASLFAELKTPFADKRHGFPC